MTLATVKETYFLICLMNPVTLRGMYTLSDCSTLLPKSVSFIMISSTELPEYLLRLGKKPASENASFFIIKQHTCMQTCYYGPVIL